MAPDEQRSAARKAQIFEAAATVFARQGYHGSRMDDIVKESGLSKGSLYWYFKSKEELATGLVHQMLAAEDAHMDTVLTDPRPATEKLEGLVRDFAGELTKKPERAALALELLALARTIPEIRDCYSTHHEDYIARVSELFTGIQRERGDRSAQDLPRAQAAARSVASVIDGMVLRWTLAKHPFDLEEQAWSAVSAIIRGL
ncbi:transcriptional regulator [Streptomyces albus]|uniref:Transcriptional regulator n=1 Tax=Streptomyces albus (strain ATCC 21838 / DSM 41398 / FERM P-419 / JCM 4703 / NBRC 107858) TaxID=1081613 RepID=A0A0B5F729_STRA4|nr:transcriptional regulator [Streptomyces albus]AOU81663.1 transcriptional regulator [Streptomyces albus]AYN37352.1 TetR/AcrR family transcriptional regulator [Streptomyces albus]